MGLRVVEWAEGIAGPYCGKLLADSGAEVVKVESPEGDGTRRTGPFPKDEPHPEKSAFFTFLNTNKRGVTIDPDDPAGRRDLEALIAGADVLIEDRPAARWEALGTDPRELVVRHPRLVAVSVSPYGRAGRNAGLPGADLVTFMVSGLGHVTPQGVQDPEREPPLRLAGAQSEFVAGLTAASGALHGLFLREAGAGGQHVDVSAQEGLASFAFMLVGATAFMKRDTPRKAPASSGTAWINALFRCADGFVCAVMMEDHQWKSFVSLLGDPAWAADPRFSDGFKRNENWTDLKPLIEAWTSHRPKAEVSRKAQARRVPILPVNTMADVAASEQLAERGFFPTVDQPVLGPIRLPGHPFRMTRTPWRAGPAPTLGQHNEEILGRLRAGESPWTVAGPHPPTPSPSMERGSHRRRHISPLRAGEGAGVRSGPLAGLRVADFSWVFAGPICTRNLAALGAEVIRIESHRRIDSHRLSGFRDAEGRPRINASPYFYLVNYNKRSISLDMTKPEGLAIAKEIVRRSDIVVENFAYGVMEKLGLGEDVLRELRPDLIIVSSSGLGRTGPEKRYVAYGTTLHAYSGLTSLTGYPGGGPRGTASTWSDPLTGLSATFAVYSALWHRRRTGEGQTIDLSMAEATAAHLAEPLLDYEVNGRLWEAVGNFDRVAAPHGTYRCQGDDQWIAIAVTDDDQWAGFCRAIGRAEQAGEARYATWLARAERRGELDALAAAWAAGRSVEDAETVLRGEGVPARPVFDGHALLADPHLIDRGFFVELDHEEGGRGPVLRLPWLLTPGPNPSYHPAPSLGADNEHVYRSFLGLGDEEMARLVEANVLY